MAWGLRMRHKPGPLGTLDGPANGSGEQPTGGPQVELYIGGWIDVTALGLVRYSQGIRVTRGQADESQKTAPSTASFRLENQDGRFNPDLATGPYYGLFERNTPCRISVQSGNGKSVRFWGEVASWPQDWDPPGNDAWVDVQAAGLLRRLGQGEQPLRSAPYLYWANAVSGQQAAAYWPMEDGSNAKVFASAVAGGQPMVISGSPSLASNSGIAPSDPLPSFTTGSGAIGSVPSYAPGSQTMTGITCYVAVPSGGETSQVLMTCASSGVYPTWELYYLSTGGGTLGWRARDSSGTVALDSTLGPTLAVNGVPVIVSADTWWDGTNVGLDFQVQVVAPGGTSTFYQVSTAAASVGRITSIKVNPTGGLTGTTIGHVAVSPNPGYAPTNDYQGNPFEHAAQRFQRLCTLAGVQSHIVFSSQSQTGPQMGPQHSGKLLDLLQECVDIDGGLMFELTDRLGLGFRLRDTLENQTSPVLTIDYSQAQLVDVPKPIKDDQFTRNDITVTRLNGSSTRAQQLTGTLNTQNPPAGVGTYPTSLTVNSALDSQTADVAGWLLHLGTTPDARYPTMGMQLSRTAVTNSATLRQQALAVTPGDRITMVNPTVAWMPPDTVSMLAIGWTEQFDQFLHKISWNTRPETPYRVAVTDDALFGHADTDGSTLVAAATATAATVSVATTGSTSPTWTTRFSDYPFDLAVGGEQMMAVAPGSALNADPGMALGLAQYTLFHSSGGVDGTYQYLTGRNPILCVPDGTDTQGGLNGHITGVGSVTAAATYTVGCWVYCPQGWSDVRACIDWYDSSSVFLSTSLGSSSSIAAGVWTYLSQDLTAVASASQCQPRFRWGSTPSSGVQFWVYTLPVVADSTVSAVSPQTLTMARSMNGVVKPQVPGTAVQLFQPATLAIQ